MPTYDYRCNACGHEFEHFQSITAPVMRKCPECGRLKLERLIGTGAGVIFKGGGFYETDYRSESYRKAAEAEKSAAGGDSTGTAKDKASGGSEPKAESSGKPAETKPKTDGAAAAKSDAGPAKGKSGASDRRAAKGRGKK